MNRGRRFVRAMRLVSGIALAAANPLATAVAAKQVPGTVVLRGSTYASTQPSPVTDGAPAVLRGSPPPPPQRQYACPPGYDYDPNYGCVVPGYAFTPDNYGYGYWPYFGFGGLHTGGSGHRFPRGFAHRPGRHLAARFSPHMAAGFAHGSLSRGGFGRR